MSTNKKRAATHATSKPSPAAPPSDFASLLEGGTRTLLRHYRIGQALAQMEAAQARSKHGTAWIQKLAKDQGVSTAPLYQALSFAKSITEEEVQELVDLGELWHMIVTTATISDKAVRLDLLHRAAREGWSVARLQEKVRRAQGQGPPERGQREDGRAPSAGRARPAADLHPLAIEKALQELEGALSGEVARVKKGMPKCTPRGRALMASALRRIQDQAAKGLALLHEAAQEPAGRGGKAARLRPPENGGRSRPTRCASGREEVLSQRATKGEMP